MVHLTQQIFELSYKEVGIDCGGEVIIASASDMVSIHSPGFPDSPSHDVTCEWIVQGPLDAGLQINFASEPRFGNCNYSNSFVEVYRGGSQLSGLVDRFCIPASSLSTVSVDSHIMLFRYVLKTKDFKSRFNATISIDSCHKQFFVGWFSNDPFEFPFKRNSVATFKWNSLKDRKCSLRLRGRAESLMQVNISAVNLEGFNCSSGDVIEFFDSSQSTSIYRLCGPLNKTSADILVPSAFNELLITYERKNFDITLTPNVNVGIKFSVDVDTKSE